MDIGFVRGIVVVEKNRRAVDEIFVIKVAQIVDLYFSAFFILRFFKVGEWGKCKKEFAESGFLGLGCEKGRFLSG